MQIGRYTNQVPSKLRLVRYTEDYLSSWSLYATKYEVFRSAYSYSHVTPGLNTTAASQQ